FLVCFGLAFWQNNVVLDVVNRPFHIATEGQKAKGTLAKTATFSRNLGALAKAQGALAQRLAADNADPATRQLAAEVTKLGNQVAAGVPSSVREPVTLGVAEPFTATFKVAGYAAILFSLPIILWQLYAFVLPAFSPRERRLALPLMSMVPVLFVAGAVFAYFVVLPNAIKVLQNFNSDNFDILIQARDLYKFTILTCIALGALFQVPVGILLLTRMEIISVAQLRANRRYAILVIAVLAMLLPGTDPVTMLLSMAPLLFLYEGSILLAALLDRRARKRAAVEGDAEDEWDLPDDDED
ncbi:MAG: twin-arginine translocase subunit TatC, partial [Solirubrobacteraceae bacterium]